MSPELDKLLFAAESSGPPSNSSDPPRARAMPAMYNSRGDPVLNGDLRTSGQVLLWQLDLLQ